MSETTPKHVPQQASVGPAEAGAANGCRAPLSPSVGLAQESSPNGRCDGVAVRMGGRDWVVPPLTLAQLRRCEEDLKKVRDITPFSPMEEVEPAIRVIHAALTRNYPDLTREALEDILDLGNVGPAFLAVCAMSGLERTREGAAEGEAPAGE